MYSVAVVFYHTSMSVYDSFSRDITIAMSTECMDLDFRPNTVSGLAKIKAILEEKYSNYRNIEIVNLIPLEKERKIIESDDAE